MELIIKVISALSDGEWHDLNELSTREGLRNMSMTKLRLILDFLAKYDFIELNAAWKGDPLRTVMEAKLQPIVQKFWKEIGWIERSEKGGKVVGKETSGLDGGQTFPRGNSFLFFPTTPHT